MIPTVKLERARRSVLYHAARLLRGFPPEGCRSCVCDKWAVIPHHEFGTVGVRVDRMVSLTKAIRDLESAEWRAKHPARRKGRGDAD